MDLLSKLSDLKGVTVDRGRLLLTQPYASARTVPLDLGGQYGLKAMGIAAEVELEDTSTGRRSVVDVRDGAPVYLFVEPGTYVLHLRFLSPPNGYDASLTLQRQGAVARLGFLAARAGRLLRHPPGEWLGIVRRRFSRRAAGVSGASLTDRAPPQLPPDRWRLPETPGIAQDDAAVSIIIPTKTQHVRLAACIASLDLSPVRKDIIIVDNGASSPQMIDCLRALALRPDVRVVRHDAPFNFSQLCNIGARLAQHPVLLFLNDDVEATDAGWLSAMLAYLAREDTGITGARLLYPDGGLQHAGIAINLIPGPGHPWRTLPQSQWQGRGLICAAGEVDAVTGACLMIDKALFDSLGGFDEQDFAVTLNDVDLCLKVRELGLKVMYVPQATLIHWEGTSRPRDDDPAEMARRGAELKAFYARHGEVARQSIFYPPHLRRDTDLGLAI